MDINLGKIKMKDYTEPRYRFISEFHDGLALVKNANNFYGYINMEGIEIIPCIYDYAEDFSESLGLVCKNNQYMFLDCTGKVTLELSHYRKVQSFHDGRAVVGKGMEQKEALWLYGYIDKTGEEVIPCQFERASDFGEGLAVVDEKNLHLKKRMKSVILYPQAWIRVIDVNGNQQFLLKGYYRFSPNHSFHNGLFPLEEYHGYSETALNSYFYPAFLDNKGQVYTSYEKVEQLSTVYKKAVKSSSLEQKRLNLNYYCSIVTFLGQKILLKENSKEELKQKKKELLSDIKTSLQTFQTEELEKIEKTGEKVKKITNK